MRRQQGSCPFTIFCLKWSHRRCIHFPKPGRDHSHKVLLNWRWLGRETPNQRFGCEGPHLWLEYIGGKHVVICPNKLNPGVADNATKDLERYRANPKKQQTNNSKKLNLASVNFSNFNEAS